MSAPVLFTERPLSRIGRPIRAISTTDSRVTQARASGGCGFWYGLGRTDGNDTR